MCARVVSLSLVLFSYYPLDGLMLEHVGTRKNGARNFTQTSMVKVLKAFKKPRANGAIFTDTGAAQTKGSTKVASAL